MTSISCCKHLSPGDPSPFEIAQLGWHDGLTSGMARCRSCDRRYFFELVAWNSSSAPEQEVRIYGFRGVTTDGFDHVVSLLDSRCPDADLLVALRDCLSSNFECTLLVVAADPSKTIMGARHTNFAFWSEVLGFKDDQAS